jgi:hypothetical protein
MPKPQIDLRSLARSYTEVCLRTLAGIAQHSTQDGARVSAASILLDRGWGKAPQQHSIDADGEIKVIIRHIIESGDEPPKVIEHNTTEDDHKT